jgi:hypothetical protein
MFRLLCVTLLQIQAANKIYFFIYFQDIVLLSLLTRDVSEKASDLVAVAYK